MTCGDLRSEFATQFNSSLTSSLSLSFILYFFYSLHALDSLNLTERGSLVGSCCIDGKHEGDLVLGLLESMARAIG